MSSFKDMASAGTIITVRFMKECLRMANSMGLEDSLIQLESIMRGFLKEERSMGKEKE